MDVSEHQYRLRRQIQYRGGDPRLSLGFPRGKASDGHLDAPNDLASDGRTLFIADGARILRIGPDSNGSAEIARFDQAVSAIACSKGQVAFALGGRSVHIRRLAADGLTLPGAAGDPHRDTAGPRPWVSINALAFISDDSLFATEGSAAHGIDDWCHDLMTLGRSGRAYRLHAGGADEIAADLGYAFGALPRSDGSIWISESWRHRVLRMPPGAASGKRQFLPVLDSLPGYPSRLSPASDGGAWLTLFTARTQLVEFVLREKAYRERMIAEVDPRYWVAPSLSSGRDFLEPLQGGGVKTMGVLKPWAPPRSYGLVIRLDPQGRPVASLHSRVGGRHHGVVAAVECAGQLFVLAKGSVSVLRIPLDSMNEADPASGETPPAEREGR